MVVERLPVRADPSSDPGENVAGQVGHSHPRSDEMIEEILAGSTAHLPDLQRAQRSQGSFDRGSVLRGDLTGMSMPDRVVDTGLTRGR